jgi:hypothetical protein
MTKLDIEKLSTIYEQISYGAPGGADKYGPTLGRGGYGTRPPAPVKKRDAKERDENEYGDTIDGDDDEGTNYLDDDSSPYKDAVFNKKSPKVDKVYRDLVDDLYAHNFISLKRFWKYFSGMYGYSVKDMPNKKFAKSNFEHAVNKVKKDFPKFPIDIDFSGEGIVHLVDE